MTGTLTHSPADIVRSLLVDLGHGTVPSAGSTWPVFVGNEPNSPDDAITVYDTTSRMDGRTQVDGQQHEHHGVQIRIRNGNHVDGYTKARAIAVALDETAYQNTVTISSTSYTVQCVSRVGGVIALGKDTPNTRRNLFTINALVSVHTD